MRAGVGFIGALTIVVVVRAALLALGVLTAS